MLRVDRRAIAFGSDDRGAASCRRIRACHSGRASRASQRSESRNPVNKAVRAVTPAVDYWVPARASPVEAGSLGRDDIRYVIALGLTGVVAAKSRKLSWPGIIAAES